MTDQPPSERFKAEMPQIPGISRPATGAANPAVKLVIGLLTLLLVVFVGARWALRPRHAPLRAGEQPQIEVPAPAPDPASLLPHATDTNPGIASIAEMAKPWTTKEFFVKNGLTGENVPSFLIRLPTGSGSHSSGYWAYQIKAPYGNCQLEYIADTEKLRKDYGFQGAKHPMVGNPCTLSVFDPIKLSNQPGDVWVRGAMVQGSDLRPPLGVEIKIEGRNIQAIRPE